MTRLAISCLFLAVLTGSVRAETGIEVALRAEVDRLFTEARRAYDENRLDEAVRLQQEIEDLGFDAPELQFNLANALFRQGQLGPAVLRYRRAQYQAPRDPDIPANLRFALETAGVELPAESLVARLTGRLREAEWVVVAVGAYWGLIVSIGIALWWRPVRKPALRAAAGLLAAGVFASLGLMHWRGLHQYPEVVVTRGEQQVLFAPLKGSTVHMLAPEGTILRVRDEADGWLKVARGKQEGWLPGDACEQVLRQE